MYGYVADTCWFFSVYICRTAVIVENHSLVEDVPKPQIFFYICSFLLSNRGVFIFIKFLISHIHCFTRANSPILIKIKQREYHHSYIFIMKKKKSYFFSFLSVSSMCYNFLISKFMFHCVWIVCCGKKKQQQQQNLNG